MNTHSGKVSWPIVVEIEVGVRCNRTCTYCPNSTVGSTSSSSFMEIDLFRRIITQLSEIDFSGRLSFHFYNEPLMRKDLEVLVAIARAALPLAHLVLYTNGDLLTDTRYQNLLEAGVDYFLVTRHGGEPMKTRLHQRVQFPRDLDLSGRAGTVVGVIAPLRRACYAPTEMLIVTVNGDVVLCHEDARREVVIGNLGRSTIQDIWLGEEIGRFRQHLVQGRRKEAGSVCARCDHRAYPGPNMTF
jgi:2-deoxy-scyllo-inosamine dehydrogenase (SAM-dependent)